MGGECGMEEVSPMALRPQPPHGAHTTVPCYPVGEAAELLMECQKGKCTAALVVSLIISLCVLLVIKTLTKESMF